MPKGRCLMTVIWAGYSDFKDYDEPIRNNFRNIVRDGRDQLTFTGPRDAGVPNPKFASLRGDLVGELMNHHTSLTVRRR